MSFQNVNSAVLFWIGVVGVVVLFAFTIPLVIQRHKKAIRQRKEYEKLSEAAKDWQKIANIQKVTMSEHAPGEAVEKATMDFMQLMGKYKKPRARKNH